MPVIDYIDGPNRRIYLHSDTVGSSVHPIDIYREMRTLRRTNESLRQYDVFLKAYGNVEKGGGKYTERYVQCMLGTRIVPYDTTHLLTITGTIITDDGQEGVSCFDRSTLTITTRVDIAYVPPQVEVITVNSGSGVTEQDKLDIADRVWDEQQSEHQSANSFSDMIENIHDTSFSARVTNEGNNTITVYKSDGVTILAVFDYTENANGEVVTITPQ